ncbi:head-tail connector protein [Propylenella binzhouense]|uniref:PhiE125 gp8 family phage protein n=1 Tax=Propylenella binzhouense TaxID=2555902 RepID=A0A964T9D8_9HYPH|nr:head-tail connector protein [Propylenella binzhouense]MYZ50470.1 hypothetical protein [Propylenella binzhouense]
MRRELISGPAAEPVLLEEAKAHLRLDTDDEDAFVGALIVAARIAIESEIRQVLIAQAWRTAIPCWRAGEAIELPVQPLLSVDAVRAVARDGTASPLPAEAYAADPAEGTATLLSEMSPPPVRYEVDFTAGMGSSGLDVPQPIRLAIRMLTTHWFENRSPVVLGERPTEGPAGWRELVAPYRRVRLC